MPFTFLQIFIVLLAATLFINTAAKFFKGVRGQTFFKFILSFFIWGGVILFALFPRMGTFLSVRLGLGSNLNTLIFIGFIIVFVILFKFMNAIERTERTLSEIVRKEALKKIRESSNI